MIHVTALLRLLIRIFAPHLLEKLSSINPWLEAQVANDYATSAVLFAQSGTGKEMLARLTPEKAAVALEILPDIMRGIDAMLPEEEILAFEKTLTG